MKKFIISFVFCLVSCIPAFAQSALPELDKIGQIKLLESTRADVKRIFVEFEEQFEDDEDGEDQSDEISTENMTIRFRYSLGTCSDDDEEEWNVPKGKVTEINVIFKGSDEPRDLKIDLSKLERLKMDEEDAEAADENEEDEDYVYYDKENGVSYGVYGGEIGNIKFTPSEKNFPALCNNETVREFVSNKDWLTGKLRNRPFISVGGRPFANLAELVLSKNELTADCPTGDSSKNVADDEYFKIVVATKGESGDPTDVLTYNYTVTGGKIVGTGANVTWDLSGVKPGEYTITAGVDNGCGVCGTTKTQVVVVRDCPGDVQKLESPGDGDPGEPEDL